MEKYTIKIIIHCHNCPRLLLSQECLGFLDPTHRRHLRNLDLRHPCYPLDHRQTHYFEQNVEVNYRNRPTCWK